MLGKCKPLCCLHEAGSLKEAAKIISETHNEYIFDEWLMLLWYVTTDVVICNYMWQNGGQTLSRFQGLGPGSLQTTPRWDLHPKN